MSDDGLPEPPAELAVVADLHGAHLEVPVDRESFVRWLVLVVPLALALVWPQALLLLASTLLGLLVLQDRRRTMLTLDGDALTIERTELGAPHAHRIPLREVIGVLATRDPPRLVVRTETDIERLEWGGSAAGLGWLAAAIRLQVERARGAAPVPPPPPELEALRR